MPRTLLVNCTAIPCDGQAAIPDAALLLDGNRLQAIDSRSALEPLTRDAGDLAVMDLGGRWLMPGLMDMHVHLGLALPGPNQLAAQLESAADLTIREYRNALDALNAGVTFIRTVGDRGYVDLSLKKAIAAGTLVGPRIQSAGRIICITGGHGSRAGSGREADGADGFRTAAREQLREGADWIKLAITGGIAGEHEQIRDPQATFEEMQAAADAAHNADKRITAHAGSPKAISDGIRAGLDCIEHGYFLDDSTVELMIQRGTYLVPTLSVSRCADYFRERNIPEWMIARSLSAGTDHMAAYQLALKAGVPIAMGTDMLPTETYDGTLAVYREMEWMVQGGMSCQDALVAATLSAAKLCRVDDQLGSLSAGKLADLVATPANPLQDIRALRQIDTVIKDGQVVRGPLA